MKIRSLSFVFLATALVFASSAQADDVLKQGTFQGASGHDTSGAVQIIHTMDGPVLRLGEDFSHDGAPDPVVGFGVNGSYDRTTEVAPLRDFSGEQDYPLPANFDADTVDQVYIWCKSYAVPLGVAELN